MRSSARSRPLSSSSTPWPPPSSDGWETGRTARDSSPPESLCGASPRRPERSRRASPASSPRAPRSASARRPTPRLRRRCSRTSSRGSGAEGPSPSFSWRRRWDRPSATSWAASSTSASAGARRFSSLARRGCFSRSPFSACATPSRGGAEAEDARLAPPNLPGGFLAACRRLLANGLYTRTVAGYAAYTFALGALAFWTPAFLERVRGVPRSEATVIFGAIAVVTGIVGTLAGGWLTDRMKPRGRRPELWLSGWATLAAAPAPQRAVPS